MVTATHTLTCKGDHLKESFSGVFPLVFTMVYCVVQDYLNV